MPGLITAYHATDTDRSEWIENKSAFDFQFGGVCGTCNSGWLRELDVVAKDVALRLALGHTTEVRADEVAPLATSLYRAALIGMWGKRLTHGLPSGRFHEFFEMRRPPTDVEILVGQSAEPFLVAGGRYSSVAPEDARELAARSFAFGTLGHLFVVCLVSEPGMSRTTARAARAMLRASNGTLTRLWQGERRVVRMPERRVDLDTALRAADLGVIMNLRAPSIGVASALAADRRFAPGGSVERGIRLPTKFMADGGN